MISCIYNWLMEHVANDDVSFRDDDFKVLLVTNAYIPDKDNHNHRSDIFGEVVGAGYAAGGNPVPCTVTRDDNNDRIDVAFSSVSWPGSTITARAAIIYKARGGPAAADELVACVDFGNDASSTNGNFIVTFSSPLRFQN